MSLEIHIFPSRLNFRFPFRIAHGERTGTDVVFLKIIKDGVVGYGEATLPPYLGITSSDVVEVLNMPIVSEALHAITPHDTFAMLCELLPVNAPAIAAIDMACWQIYAQQQQQSISDLLLWPKQIGSVPHTYTLGVSTFEEMQEKVGFGLSAGFSCFKLKLDGSCDERIVSGFRKITNLSFAVDANQAWKTKQQAADMLKILEEEQCILIEQPFDKADRAWSRDLAESTDIPIIADEACQGESDLMEIMTCFDGVNVKLQKCGGITPAARMLELLKQHGKLALMGCMSESSIGCNAAEQLIGKCNWADLDGPWLNSNNDQLLEDLGYAKYYS